MTQTIIGLLFGGIFIGTMYVYFKSLITLRTNQIFLMERGSPKEKGGKFVWCEGILSTRPESGEKAEGFDYETAEHSHPHFNDPRDRKNFDPTYNVGYILFQKWKSWNHKDGTWGADHTYKDPGYQPDFIERHFNRKWPGAPYFMIKKKRYRNYRTIVEYGKTDQKTGKVELMEVIRSTEQLQAGMADKRHLFHYNDGTTVVVLYLVSDMSDHFFYEYSYDVLVKVVTGVSTKTESPKKKEATVPDPGATVLDPEVIPPLDPAVTTPETKEKAPFENLQLGLHLRIKVRMRDPEYFCYVSNNMIEEIMAELTEVCQDVANSYDYLKLINSQETDDSPEGYAEEIIRRLEKRHEKPKKEGVAWKHHAWDLLGMTFKKIVGYREIDQKYLDTISEAPLNIKKEEARRAGLIEQEKNTEIENRITISKEKAAGTGKRQAIEEITPALVELAGKMGDRENKVIEGRPVDPNIERISIAAENTKLQAISMGGGESGILHNFQVGSTIDMRQITSDALESILGKKPNPADESKKEKDEEKQEDQNKGNENRGGGNQKGKGGGNRGGKKRK